MQPVQDLLSRIRWDQEFGEADFDIGYYDRVEGRILLVPFEELNFPADNQQSFELLDSAGEARRIPFHRVREVHRNGHCIWKRQIH